jgi:DNA-binding MarR family transcriptional regulator
MRRDGERDLGLAGWIAFQLYRVALTEGLGRRGFTDLRDTDWTLLRFLHHHGAATVTEIAHLFGVTKQAASQQVASFVERGYGTKTPSEHDARVRAVALSVRGNAAWRAAVDVADEVEADLDDHVGPAALRQWRKVTDALIALHLDGAPEMVRVATEMSSARDRR